MTGMEAATVVALVGTAATVYSTVQAGKAQKREADRMEQGAKADAMSREIQRTKRLNAYLATVNAEAGAAGVASNIGSLANAQKVAIRENKLGAATEDAASKLRIQGYRDQGKTAYRASLVGAVAEGAGGISNAMDIEG